MLGLLFFIVFVVGAVQIFREYHYILDYKRDERMMHEYEKMQKKDLESIVDDANNSPF
jgi:hypothetical protein